MAFARSLVDKFGLKPVTPTAGVMSPEFIRRQVDVCLEERIAVFAAGLGDPGWVVPLAHQAGMKVLGLVGYIVLGSIALKRGRTTRIRMAAFVGALALFAYIVSVAITKSPAGFLAWL